MNNLPIEILSQILSNLDLELLKIYCVVSKKWNESIKLSKSLFNVQYSTWILNKITNGYHAKYRKEYIIFDYLVVNEYFNLLKYIINCGYKISEMTIRLVAIRGQIEFLQWLYNNGHWKDREWDSIGYKAAISGNLELIKWLKEINYHWLNFEDDLCCGAVKDNNLELLKWLRLNGYNWNENTLNDAYDRGYYDIIKWALENGCGINTYDAYNHVIYSKYNYDASIRKKILDLIKNYE